MKPLRIILLFFMLNPIAVFSQKYHLTGVPADGYFYVDTASKNQYVYTHSNRSVDIVSENSTVYASGRGVVIYCNARADKTYEIAIKYESSVVRYINIAKKKVQRAGHVDQHTVIGESLLNPKDKHFHFGLQVVSANNPNEILWGLKLAGYLNAIPVASGVLAQSL